MPLVRCYGELSSAPVKTSLCVVFSICLLAVGCSTSLSIGGQTVDAAAVSLIESDLAEEFDLPLEATCPTVDNAAVGSEFECTATDPEGRTLEFDVLVDAEDHIEVSSINVVRADALADIEAELDSRLVDVADEPLLSDCGDDTVILGESREMVCQIGTSAEPSLTTADVTVVDTTTGEMRFELVPYVVFVPEETAAELIETELSEIVGAPMTAQCPTAIDTAVGTTFECTGRLADERVVKFNGLVDQENHVDLNTTNFLREEVVVAFEDAAAEALAPQTLTDTLIECVPRPVLFNAAGEISCNMTLGDDPEVRIARIKITDFETLAFTVAVE